MTDEHWQKVLTALRFKAREEGLQDGPDTTLRLIKENWDLFGVERDVDAYIASRLRAEKDELRAQLQAQLDELNTEIAALPR